MENLLRRIETDIAAKGGKRSRARTHVIEAFFRLRTHATAEEVVAAARKTRRDVGASTVYRTLKLLARLGYAKELDFGEGVTRYESTLAPHHDHLVCTACGDVAEFEDPGIETLQEQAARRHGFRPTAHRLDIYGVCRRCSVSPPSGSRG